MSRRKIDSSVFERYKERRLRGGSQKWAAREAGITERTARNWDARINFGVTEENQVADIPEVEKALPSKAEARRVRKEAAMATKVMRTLADMTDGALARKLDLDEDELGPVPKKWADLSADAQADLDNFRRFRAKYFARSTPNWQVEMADTITKSSGRNLLVLAPPGHGKSKMVSCDYALYRMVRARAKGDRFACLIISGAEVMAKSFLAEIQNNLTKNQALIEAFGRFRPENPAQWNRTQVMVEGFDMLAQGKEATFQVAGAGTHIYGWRVDLILADDIVTTKNSGTPEGVEALHAWFVSELESRLNPAGTLVVCGTRFRPHDLYGRLIDKNADADDPDDPPYDVHIYRAHDPTKCPGADGPHEEYPSGCTLWPDKHWWPYEKLRREQIKSPNPRYFDYIYNQLDYASEDSLVKPEWIEGCKDNRRDAWHIPQGTVVIGSIDPSPTEWASIQVWAYDRNPESRRRYLVAHRRAKISGPQLIPLMEEWTLRCRALGHDIRWIVEMNSVRGWLDRVKEWREARERTFMQIIPHTTGRNKADPTFGIQMLSPLYEYAKVSLPWAGPEGRAMSKPLIDELLVYPDGRTDDCVMAQWFFEHNLRTLAGSEGGGAWAPGAYDPVPDYLKERRKLISLNGQVAG